MTARRSGMRVNYKRLLMNISCTFSQCAPMIARPWCLPRFRILAEKPGIEFPAFIVDGKSKWIGLRGPESMYRLPPERYISQLPSTPNRTHVPGALNPRKSSYVTLVRLSTAPKIFHASFSV